MLHSSKLLLITVAFWVAIAVFAFLGAPASAILFLVVSCCASNLFSLAFHIISRDERRDRTEQFRQQVNEQKL